MAISVGGLMSGLDTNGMIDQMLEIQQRPIVALQKNEAEYQVKLTTYGTLKSVLSGLKTSLSALDSAEDLTRFTAQSGDTDLFSVSADESAAAGTYKITVSQMADVHKLTSTAFAQGEAVGEGTLHLSLGAAASTDIAVSDTDTIQDVAKAINAANAGVKAAVIFDGTDYHLTLSGEETGEANEISLTVTEAGTDPADPENTDTTGLSRLVYDSGGATNMTNTQSAADAIITVDGVAGIHRSTNVMDDVIEGVTITLASAPDAPDNTSTLSITQNTGAASKAVNDFVTNYNMVLDFFESQQKYDAATGEAGVLLGDATTNTIRNRLKALVSGGVYDAGSVEKLADLGVSLNGSGRLEVNAGMLGDALDDRFDDVVGFFTGTDQGAEGFAVRMADALDAVLDESGGSLAARTNGIRTSIENLQERVERLEARNVAWEERTRAQFNSLEVLLAQYQTTGDYLTQQITGLQNLNNYITNR
jgi:flagellar hook-associated protein 2